MTRTLAGRVVLTGIVVAVVASLVTGGLLIGLTRAAGAEFASASLARDVELLAAAVEDAGPRRPRAGAALERVLERRLVRVAVLPASPSTDDVAAELERPFRESDVVEVTEAGALSETRGALGRSWVVEGRLAGDRVVLAAQPLDEAAEPVAQARRRIGVALVVGLVVAVASGLLLARRLAAQLGRVSAAADRLSAGDRSVRLPPDGPAELASLAGAMNGLSDALARSEDRQRRFLLSVSHELRTPLTSVLGWTEALADDTLPPQERAQAARVARTEALRLQGRVEDLLALARLEADDFRVELAAVDVASVLVAAREAWLVRTAAAGVDLALELPATRLVAWTDGERLRQVIDALVDNALRVLHPGAPLVVAGARGPGDTAIVQVRDGGPGLAPGDYAVAFEPGELTRRYEGSRPVGSGVGLALVARLAERLGGGVTASPAPEGGLAVTVSLPAAASGPSVAGQSWSSS